MSAALERRLHNHLALKALPTVAASKRWGSPLDRDSWIEDLVAFAAQLCRDCGWRLTPKRQRAVSVVTADRYWPSNLQVERRQPSGWHRERAGAYAALGFAVA